MRVWYVPFYELDSKRLTAQHQEYHMLVAHVALGRRWLKWHEPDRSRLLHQVHERAVNEMRLRGMTGHRTPAAVGWEPGQLRRYDDLEVMLQLQRHDREVLVGRWGGVYRGRTPLRVLSAQAQFDYARAGVVS